MYCPNCGQQQVSGNLRFCSRCGLPLDLISEFLANGGTLPQLLELNKKTIFSRRNGVIFSLFWLLFFLLIVTPFWGILDVDKLAGMSAIIGIFGGLLLFLASLLFLRQPQKNYPFQQSAGDAAAVPANLTGNRYRGALPPQQTRPAQDYVSPMGSWRAPDTGDLLQPGSVTEGTTKLLQKDGKELE